MAVKTQKKKQTLKSNKQKTAKQEKNFTGYFIAGILLILFFFYTSEFTFIQDDSYITYRYVKNLTEGNGLVFNIGERVEGYTNFLWVIILSVIKFLGANYISFSQTAGILLSMLAAFFTYKISSEIFRNGENTLRSSLLKNISVLFLIANGAFAYWAVSGMETGFFTFLVTLGIYLYLKEIKTGKNYYSSAVFLLSALTRPEGVLIFIITAFHKIYYSYKKSGSQNKISDVFSKPLIIWLAIFFIPGLLYMIWRLSYFGHLLPNTFYAKTGSSWEYFKTGFEYFWDFTKIYGLYGLFIIFALYNFILNDKKQERNYLLALFIIFSLYVISVGGDVLRPSRFFLPVLPVLAILVQEGMIGMSAKVFNKNKTESMWMIPAIASVIFAYIIYNTPYDDIKRYSELENGLTDKMRISGTWLKNKQMQEGRQLTVAATTIGAISYFSETTLIDMLGLTDEVIAHEPKPIPEISENTEIGWKERQYNVDYIVSRKPDYVYFSTGIKPSAYAERGLFTNEEFIKYYYPYYFTIKEYNFTETIYKRRTDEQALKIRQNDNPNYKKSFVNLFNQALNTSRDKSKAKESIALYEETINVSPSNFSLPYQLIGEIYMQQKQTDKAIEYFNKAIEIDDMNIMAHVGLYQIYAQKGDNLNAEKSLEKIKIYAPELL